MREKYHMRNLAFGLLFTVNVRIAIALILPTTAASSITKSNELTKRVISQKIQRKSVDQIVTIGNIPSLDWNEKYDKRESTIGKKRSEEYPDDVLDSNVKETEGKPFQYLISSPEQSTTKISVTFKQQNMTKSLNTFENQNETKFLLTRWQENTGQSSTNTQKQNILNLKLNDAPRTSSAFGHPNKTELRTFTNRSNTEQLEFSRRKRGLFFTFRRQRTTTPVPSRSRRTTTPVSSRRRRTTTPVSSRRRRTTITISSRRRRTTTPISSQRRRSVTQPVSVQKRNTTKPSTSSRRQTTTKAYNSSRRRSTTQPSSRRQSTVKPQTNRGQQNNRNLKTSPRTRVKPTVPPTDDIDGYSGWNIIFPGTKWCGSGSNAESHDDLGFHADTDKCCRSHDRCNDTMAPGQTKYNITNTSTFTKLSCRCDTKFYECLEKVNTMVSNKIGIIYFNILRQDCYKKDYPATENCKSYTTLLKINCVEYERNTEARKVYQWVPPTTYKQLPIPGPLTIKIPFT